jgi:enediyne biosynthesis protein E3
VTSVALRSQRAHTGDMSSVELPVSDGQSASSWVTIDAGSSLSSRLKLRVLGIDESEASLDRNGFCSVDDRAREHLELVGRWFVRGYHAALTEPGLERLAAMLNETPADFRGFAYEGAGTALTVIDTLAPVRRRLRAFLRGPGLAYSWILPIGYGWARMRIGRPPRRPPAVFDPIQGWLAVDGAGFHEGFTRSRRYFDELRVPSWVSPQGLGRSLWFVRGGDAKEIAKTLIPFSAARRADIWSGVASAATYAGGVDSEILMELRESADGHQVELAVGAAIAAKARLLGGNATEHTERACLILCGTGTIDAARCTDAAMEGILTPKRATSPYAAWRARIGELLAPVAQ